MADLFKKEESITGRRIVKAHRKNRNNVENREDSSVNRSFQEMLSHYSAGRRGMPGMSPTETSEKVEEALKSLNVSEKEQKGIDDNELLAGKTKIKDLEREIEKLKEKVMDLKEENAKKEIQLEKSKKERVSVTDLLIRAPEVPLLTSEELDSLRMQTAFYLSSLDEEVRKRREKEKDERLCILCFDDEKNMACIPCGHINICYKCSESSFLDNCPVCRKNVIMFQKVYFS
eukprot:TRINITY_DN1811_c0_g1_i2.p1 TRINITY_DN1811_c0_g1~~TRINITY_DN1811_c0_g1_i2.p1  ORF type:complete len:241 (+),score=65.54 TRINITY_DN1811_c0_g1_i2:32-724(+)